MFLFLTTSLFWTFALGQVRPHNPWDYAEILPSKGQCSEGKNLDRETCKDQSFHILCEGDCWGGSIDVTTYGCGCVIGEHGQVYYNEGSGKSCNPGKEVSMVCKKEIDVEPCKDVDGWSVHCSSECGDSLWYPRPEKWQVHNTHGNIDYSHFTIDECAALCVDDCVAFDMHVDGCGSFYSGLQFSSSSSSRTSTSCVTRTPSVEGDCADYDAGEGWAVDCGHYCERYDVDGGTSSFSWDAPWTTGVSITQCVELCEADDCDHFNFNPQNGGSCQFFSEKIAEPGSLRILTDGACVYRGSDDTDNVMSFDDCPENDPGVWEMLKCFETDAEGNSKHMPESNDEMTRDELNDAVCVWYDNWFSEGGCCENCHPCVRESFEAVYREAGYDLSECESEDDFFTKIKNGDFSSLTTLEWIGIGVSALVLFTLLVGICCCCCKCSNGKH